MAKIGRPSIYSKEIRNSVCTRIAVGESLRSICQSKDLPTIETIRRWLRDKPEFCAQYARARDEQADFYADEMREIADNTNDPAKARLQIDTRKWIASKLKPKKYGDSHLLKHADANGDPLQSVLEAAATNLSQLTGKGK